MKKRELLFATFGILFLFLFTQCSDDDMSDTDSKGTLACKNN